MDFTQYTDDGLKQLQAEINTEQVRRADLAHVPEAIDALNRRYLNADGVVPGQEWRQPTGAHDAYPLDWQVTHNGKTWQSLVTGNVWEPGVSNWQEAVPDTAPPPDWVQPTGSTDAYKTGDKVTYQGAVYTSTVDANVWSPTDYPQGWSLDTAV